MAISKDKIPAGATGLVPLLSFDMVPLWILDAWVVFGTRQGQLQAMGMSQAEWFMEQAEDLLYKVSRDRAILEPSISWSLPYPHVSLMTDMDYHNPAYPREGDKLEYMRYELYHEPQRISLDMNEEPERFIVPQRLNIRIKQDCLVLPGERPNHGYIVWWGFNDKTLHYIISDRGFIVNDGQRKREVTGLSHLAVVSAQKERQVAYTAYLLNKQRQDAELQKWGNERLGVQAEGAAE